MLYLVYGDQNAMIKSRVNKIIKERLDFVDEFNYVRYDINDDVLFNVIEEANSTPLGYDRKVIVLYNCWFLVPSRGKNKAEIDQDLAKLIKYLNSPNESTDIIFTINKAVLDEKSDIVKLIKEKGKTFQLLSPAKNDFSSYIRDYFKKTYDAKIDPDAIYELANRIQGNLDLFINEAQKLYLYSGDHIRYEDVSLMVNKPLEENAFEIFNKLLGKNNQDAISIFKDLRIANVEPVTLISLLANQFRLLWQIIYLMRKGNKAQEISSILNIKEIRAKIMMKNAYIMTAEAIEEVIENLFLLDYKIKSGQVDRFYAFELFLIKFKTE
jgi:DNA polymerase-3 subunit delta